MSLTLSMATTSTTSRLPRPPHFPHCPCLPRTDGQTNRPTNQPTDIVAYRAPIAAKNEISVKCCNFWAQTMFFTYMWGRSCRCCLWWCKLKADSLWYRTWEGWARSWYWWKQDTWVVANNLKSLEVAEKRLTREKRTNKDIDNKAKTSWGKIRICCHLS